MSHPRSSDPNYLFSRWLSLPPPGEEVVVSGMSGRMPDSNNLHHFRDNLFNKIEMVSDDDRRWKLDHKEIPQRTAKIYDMDKCDAGFFGLHYRQTMTMDPMIRIILENAIEAVMDAGFNPSELEGTRTGVFVSASWSDMENRTLTGITEPQRFGMTGYLRSLIAHRLSYYLKLKGPSMIVDTACSSSGNALEQAFKSIRSGQCDQALVGCSNLLMHPGNSLQFFRLGVLSTDGTCRVFDQNASGYVRGETIACVFLQKAKDSRRIYAQIINTKINSDGFKEQGITFPSTEAQKQLMMELYQESNVHPEQLSFLEAHGTGTQVGDPQEVEAIDCALAKPRKKCLLVGSVKSSIGHTEPASGVCSLIKVLLTMESGLISPNINLKKIKEGMLGFEQGRMKAVTEVTPLEGEEAIVGINNFGFGGNNCHAILKRFKKVKIDKWDDVPRLVCVSGRTEDAVLQLIEDIGSKRDVEHIALLHHIFKKDIRNHLYRGYTIVSKTGTLKTSIRPRPVLDAPFYVFFGPFQQNYKVLGSYLLNFPTFKNTITRINKVLSTKDIEAISKSNNGTHYQDLLGSIFVQIGFVDVLKTLELYPTVYGDSWGKIATWYFYETLSLDEAVAAASTSCQKSLDFAREVPNNNLRGDALNHQSLVHKNSLVLNVSDGRLNNKDVVLTDGEKINFFETIGSLYEMGHTPQLHKLYPEVELPVSRSTPMVSPLIKWNHDKTWHTYKFSEFTKSDAEQREYFVSFFYEEFKFIEGHVIDGRNLFPATEYLNLVWQTLAQSLRLMVEDFSVVFENCKFVRAVTMPKSGFVKLLVTVQKGVGSFEVLEKDTLVVSGKIRTWNGHQETDFPPIELGTDTSEVLEHDEIYRELYLRGYNYSGLFKGVAKCNLDASSGLIKWENNWSTFTDKMLQMKILQNDTRLLYVPVEIKKMVIDPIKHKEVVDSLGGNGALVPVYCYKESNTIKSGGIEILGLQAKSIAKKKQRLEPVLEKYQFVPNTGYLDLVESIRVNTQIIIENTLENNFKAVEILDDFTNSDNEFLAPLVCKALDHVPVINPNVVISTKVTLDDIPGVKIEDFVLTPESNLILIIGTKLLDRTTIPKLIFQALGPKGFIITREDLDFQPKTLENIDIITEFSTHNEKLIMFRKSLKCPTTSFIEVQSDNFEWLPQLKKSVQNDQSVVVYAQNTEPEGILGLVNCLRPEPGGDKVRGFFLIDGVPRFDPEEPFYEQQIRKNLAINVYKDGKWGTYRHLLLEELKDVQSEHCYANVTVRGELSSLKWLEGPLRQETKVKDGHIMIINYYSAINFKDVMLASGRINVDIITDNRMEQECPVGFEFAGRDLTGRRVIGMTDNGAFSSHISAGTSLLWEIPDSWSLEDGATVPVVYGTVLYALLMVRKMKPGSSILIHSATGGIGLAAINVCLYYNCTIYLTVGTQEKREYLRKTYPQIPNEHIGNSRDLSFEEMIKKQTKGEGVDIVLNSLSEEKLMASVRCLRRGGSLLEIGKFDLANNTRLGLLMMEKGISYHGVMLDQIYTNRDDIKIQLFEIIRNGINIGFIKPLPKTVFKREEIEAAHRYMMTGKHMGKVILKIRDEEKEVKVVPTKQYYKVYPKFFCDSTKVYIIIGGLGGVGLELADWLVLRKATKLVLVSRFGIKTGYQAQRIKIWESYGVTVKVTTNDITTKQGCFDLIKEAKNLGPIDGIFNLGVVLKDALFEDQNEDTFRSSRAPKSQATLFLDHLTRDLCKDLRYFVVFSSVACGRGNPGQTNYGMANSIMERICEKRKREGYPAVAIQWGAIGDVGLVAKMQKENKELVIGGTLQQKIASCLEVLDKFLKQENPVVSSMVVAEKHNRNNGTMSAVEAVACVLGIKDIKTVSQHATLAELGMDSMMGTEIIQLLEKEHEIYITAKEVRSMTFAKLSEIEAEKATSTDEKTADETQQFTGMLMQYIPDSKTGHLPIIRLPSSVKDEDPAPTIFVLSGIEGAFHPIERLTKKLKAHVYGVQYDYHNPEDTISEVAQKLLPHIEAHLPPDDHFKIIGYSYGAAVGLEIVKLLENKGHTGKIVVLDGSPTYLTTSAKEYLPEESEAEFQTALIYKILAVLLPIDLLTPFRDSLLKCGSLEERCDLVLEMLPIDVEIKQKMEKQAALTLYKRFKAVIGYRFEHEKIKSEVQLVKAKFAMVNDEEDYQLSKICEKGVVVSTVNGDHVTMLDQDELVVKVEEFLI